MSSKHWIKRSNVDPNQDLKLWYPGMGVMSQQRLYIALGAFVLVGILGVFQSSNEMVISGFGGATALGAFILYARSQGGGEIYRLSRKMKLSYNAADYGLRKLFKEQNINFVRKKDKTLNTHQYVFPLHNTSLSLNPYDYIYGIEHGQDAHTKAMAPEQLGVLMTLNTVNKNNQPFIDTLTSAIDQMALQPIA